MVNVDEMSEREYEKNLYAYAFHRTEYRACRSKRLCDCGHWVDGSIKTNDQIYRYTVWRTNDMPRNTIMQRIDCEICAREDLNG
jgi:hypothetical protein